MGRKRNVTGKPRAASSVIVMCHFRHVCVWSKKTSPFVKRLTQELGSTVSVPLGGRSQRADGVVQGSDGTEPFDRVVVKQRNLVEERNEIISDIRNRPAFQGFLTAPSFSTLRTSASHGPVILINHCERRSDILIICDNSPPCSIFTTDDFYNRTKRLQDEQVQARKHGLDSCEYQDALSFVLKTLYDLVGAPVIKKLRVLGVPEQSRVWWCPMPILCSLPLHAMGPIPSSDNHERYFSDSLPGVNEEIKVIRSLREQTTVTDLISSEATSSSVVEGLRGNQFAHFACHGVLDAGKLFDASFILHGGSHLTLLDIVQSQLPNVEFAFLSCCHSAEITDDGIPDEMLHLAAAMQSCGFRSVVGTMWKMADTDGQDLATSFYKSLFSGQEEGVPYYERAARSLRNATQKLPRKRGVTLERWVNFVHFGA